MIVAAAFCPHPPLLVPEVAQGAARELDDLRSACDLAVDALRSAGSERVVVLGGPPAGAGRTFEGDAVGTLDGYGVPMRFGRGAASVEATLPLSLTIGAYLLERADWSVPRSYVQVGLAPTLVETGGPTGLLVMGDGSARRSAAAPGALDHRAEAFDDQVLAALRAGDPEALQGLDSGLGAELLVAGTAAWQTAGALLAGEPWQARLLAGVAPYGVGYLVAVWER